MLKNSFCKLKIKPFSSQFTSTSSSTSSSLSPSKLVRPSNRPSNRRSNIRSDSQTYRRSFSRSLRGFIKSASTFVVVLFLLELLACSREEVNINLVCEGSEIEKAHIQMSNTPPLDRTTEVKKNAEFHFRNKQLMLEDDTYIACLRWDAKVVECDENRVVKEVGSNHFYLKYDKVSGRVLSTVKLSSKNADIERKSESRFIGTCTALKH